jgi:hypothetical protein
MTMTSALLPIAGNSSEVPGRAGGRTPKQPPACRHPTAAHTGQARRNASLVDNGPDPAVQIDPLGQRDVETAGRVHIA